LGGGKKGSDLPLGKKWQKKKKKKATSVKVFWTLGEKAGGNNKIDAKP